MSETGREPESAIFDVTRVGSGRGRPPVLVLGFAGLLAGVVALGVTGRSQAEPVGPVAVATASPTPILIPGQRGPRVFPPVAPATTSSAGQTGIRGYLGVDVVELAVPHRDDEIVRGSTVTVSGSLRIHAATLLIQIQGADQAVLASQVIDTANRDGGFGRCTRLRSTCSSRSRPRHPRAACGWSSPRSTRLGTRWARCCARSGTSSSGPRGSRP